MAVKIVRQPKKIALIGAPSSAAAFSAGSEKAPAVLRAAGLAEKLQATGYEVVDYGDCAPRLFADDDEHRRARNLTEIVAGLNDLKTRAELAVKSGAFVLVLGGDCAQVIGLLSGARRYYKHLNLLWFDRDADLNTPASTPSGRIDGMVVAHIIGKGAPELWVARVKPGRIHHGLRWRSRRRSEDHPLSGKQTGSPSPFPCMLQNPRPPTACK